MTYNFVTIFNNLYLPQAISLHKSIKRFSIKFKLWALCIDEESYNYINNLGYKSFKAVKFSKFESPKLKKIRNERSIAEYCWTITPMSPKIIFNINKKIKFVTYIDTDMFFFKNPSFLIDKFIKSKKKILFTNHDFNDNEKFKEKIYGKFCVQFMTFKKNGSEKIRKIWEKKCLEWCFAKPSNGRMGDQKYLDDIYKKFKKKIFILDDDFFRSTWNYKKIKLKKIVAWHFHGFKIINKKLILMHHLNFLPVEIKNKIYMPYIKSISKSIKKINFNKTQYYSQKGIIMNIIDSLKFKFIQLKIIQKEKYWNLN